MFKKLIVFASLIVMTMGKQHHHKHQHHSNSKHSQIQTKTVTETVTHTVTTNKGHVGTPVMYITKTLDCQPTDMSTATDETYTTDITTDTVTDTIDSQTECLSYFNKFRASQNLEPFEQATQDQIDCANKAAVNDAQMGYHNSFYQRMCPVLSQIECLKGVNGGGLKNCIDAYISEGPPGTQGAYPQENHGHWNIIVGPYKYVACGTDNNGFYTHNFYN